MSAAEKVIVKKTFATNPETLFKAWTTPDMMVRWFDAGGGEGCERVPTVRNLSLELKVGGRFSFDMGEGEGKNGDDNLRHQGEYREISRFSRLAFTWTSPAVDNSLVTLEFRPTGNKTELILTHELLPQRWLAAHQGGWTQIFENLAATF